MAHRLAIPSTLLYIPPLRMTKKKQLNLNDPTLTQVIHEQLTAFTERFGRKPTPDDPIFFCWHSATPKPRCELCDAEYEHAVIEAAEEAGIDPAQALHAAGIDDPLGSLKTKN